MLTLTQCSIKCGIPASTCANYRNLHKQYFHIEGEGRNRKYDPSTIELLIEIQKLYNEGLSRIQVDEALEARYGVQVESAVVPTNSTTTQHDVIEAIRSVFREENESLIERIDRMEKAQEERGEKHDRLLMENIRLLQNKQQLKWWKRLFKGV